MNQGRAEVDVKNGDQEHTMHKETSEYEDRYTHGNSRMAKQSPTLRGSEKNKVRQVRLNQNQYLFIIKWEYHDDSHCPGPTTNLCFQQAFSPEVLVKSHYMANSDFQIVIMSQHLWYLVRYQMASKDY